MIHVHIPHEYLILEELDRDWYLGPWPIKIHSLLLKSWCKTLLPVHQNMDLRPSNIWAWQMKPYLSRYPVDPIRLPSMTLLSRPPCFHILNVEKIKNNKVWYRVWVPTPWASPALKLKRYLLLKLRKDSDRYGFISLLLYLRWFICLWSALY